MDHNLRFSVSSFTEQGSYKLMELPPELCKVMEESLSEGGDSNSSSFYIKGQPGEDAVLCTQDKTYTIRSVSLSNSILVVTSPPDSDISFDGGDNGLPNIVIRDQLSQILELTQTVPKLHKLNTLLKGKEYGEDEEDNEDGMNVELAIDHSQNMEHFTYTDARAMIQASETELKSGLRQRRILQINETLRPISSIYLTKIIQYILNTLAALMLNHESVPVEKLCTTLADEHDVPRIVSVQVMGWFGDINEIDGKWKMDVNSVVKEAGLGILKDAKDRSYDKDDLISTWKDLVGDKFNSSVSLDLLAGNYLIAPAAPYSDHQVVKYFPISSLPIDPAQRFSDLFLTRSKWKNEDIVPFLSDIAVNSKERDKLLLKYARATTDAEGIWYTSRAQYNG
ncbi:sister chromatid cohesion protein Dcc1 [Lentinula edodes]|uniref:Sister chromatid cohesion protein Dcc1 n=1 Tax=Lentinula lateritia TaxID=40482 RepID=A0A9W9AH44_9AGAR|nr:sister chromatid cohesion protein Dcc1 [Lentinula edodes]KAH7879924.1 sister chromatid cohesion protein Dcc1 [Lentinula edodes]KAJ4481634.1 sister chromatid cohesion protein Dcc1 [Lentinula edodes]